ncbi:MAG: hypothetical protein ACD_54C00662G0004 [uncultured bacterium]|nr:MAG: hypothetical protein ACD_54C00662G0004 [uncultured bacterium]
MPTKACCPTETSPANPASMFQFIANTSRVSTPNRSCVTARGAISGTAISAASSSRPSTTEMGLEVECAM